MNKKKLNKRLIIIFLILFPTAMLFGFLNNVRAGTDIPDKTDDPENRNGWTWGVGTDDELAYEVEIIMTDNETGDLYWQMRYLDILRISDIDSDFFEFMGQYDNMSYVEAKRYYYECYPEGGGDVVEILDSKGYPIKDFISVFGFNNSDTIKEKFIAQTESRFYPPLLLPLNDSDICPTMHDIIYEGQIKYFENIYCNVFNDRGLETVDTKRDKIWFQNTTEDYFMNCTYFRINGTLESAEMYYLMNMDEGNGNGGPSGWMAVNTTMTRVYGPDYCAAITDEVVWNFDVGDVFYYGMNNEEYMLTITNKTWCMSFETHVMEFESRQPYNAVNASMRKWDKESEDYSIDEGEQIVAVANNYYPFPLEMLFGGEEEGGGGPVLAVPDGTDAEDIAFVLNNFTMEEWPFEVYIADNGKTIDFTDKEEGGTISTQYDDLGILKIGYMEFGGWLEGVYFRKNMTTLDNGADWEPLGWDMVGSNEVLVNFTATDDLELYSAVLPVNPLEPLAREEGLEGCYFEHEIPDLPLYIDLYTNNSIAIGTPIKMNITYDPDPFTKYDILEIAIKVYGFNFSGYNEWDEAPDNIYLDRDVDNDVITINATYAIINKYSYLTIGVEESWNWSDDVFSAIDDILIYESLGNLAGNITEFGGIVNIPYINFAILNITDVGLVDGYYQGDPQEFNQVNTSLMYYDPVVNDLVIWDDAEEFTLSDYYYNQSRDPGFYINLTENMLGFPMIIPLRWEELALPTIGRVLNETFYSSPLAREIGFPIWDEIRVNTFEDMLIFNDTTSDYFMELTYYDNGTLKEAEVSTKFTVDSEDIDFNLTSTRMFDWNTTSEVEWDLEVGESYYFGTNFPEGGPTYEINVTIVKFNQSAVFLADLFGFESGAFMFETWLTFENVWAKVEYWNVTDLGNGVQIGEWIPVDDKNPLLVIAAANNYYPFAPGDYLYEVHGIEGFMIPSLLPLGTDGHDLAKDFLDYISLMVEDRYEGDVVAALSEVDDEYLKIDLIAPGYPEYNGYLEWYLNNDTGITRYWYLYDEYMGETITLLSLFLKNHSSGNGDASYIYNNYLVPEVNATVDIECFGDFEFFEALLNRNPVNGSLPSGIGTPMFYTDIFFINRTNDSYNLTFTMELPSKYDVQNVKYVAIYIPDYEKQEGNWEYQPITDIEFFSVTKDTQNNILILRIENMNGTISAILAWMYSAPAVSGGGDGGGGGGGDKEPAPIPGYDIYILLMLLSLISIIVIIQRRKKIRF